MGYAALVFAENGNVDIDFNKAYCMFLKDLTNKQAVIKAIEKCDPNVGQSVNEHELIGIENRSTEYW